MSTATLRMAEVLRRLNDTCRAASELCNDIERQMGSAHAREQPAKDDTDVIIARNIAPKKS